MAKIYGGRWKLIDRPRLGGGGQSEVFRVIDDTGERSGEFALKRVTNPARHERFRQEVEAIKSLDHPNVIKLVDHSMLDATDVNPDKQYLVMPIAEGGDLTKSGRLGLYKGSIESTLQVAKQIASALAAAHFAGIIHRDIKPANILFTGDGHEVWLTDFGICLITKIERATETGEVVGPQSFMAPELESGGQLNVTPSADIYSLGKVIYFMVTGGRVLPRERLHAEAYSQIFNKGARYHVLDLLLSKMICPPQSRLQDMREVEQEIQKIVDWEQTARQLPLSPTGLAAIERLQKRAVENRIVSEENAAARAVESRTLATVIESLLGWLRDELGKVAATIRTGTLISEVRDTTILRNEEFRVIMGPRSGYIGVGGVELTLKDESDALGRVHLLQLFLCEERNATFTVSMGAAGHPNAKSQPARDMQLSFIPFYRQLIENQSQSRFSLDGYITRKGYVGQPGGRVNFPIDGGPRMQPLRWSHVSGTFDSQTSQHFLFKASEWPAVTDRIREALSEAIEVFVKFVDSGANQVGP